MAIRELTIEKVREQVGQDSGNDTLYKIVIYNDDVNTFEWVIESLMKVCDHTHEQADQSAWIIHTKGKYAVKHGGLDYLLPRKHALEDRGLSAVIEE